MERPSLQKFEKKRTPTETVIHSSEERQNSIQRTKSVPLISETNHLNEGIEEIDAPSLQGNTLLDVIMKQQKSQQQQAQIDHLLNIQQEVQIYMQRRYQPESQGHTVQRQPNKVRGELTRDEQMKADLEKSIQQQLKKDLKAKEDASSLNMKNHPQHDLLRDSPQQQNLASQLKQKKKEEDQKKKEQDQKRTYQELVAQYHKEGNKDSNEKIIELIADVKTEQRSQFQRINYNFRELGSSIQKHEQQLKDLEKGRKDGENEQGENITLKDLMKQMKTIQEKVETIQEKMETIQEKIETIEEQKKKGCLYFLFCKCCCCWVKKEKGSKSGVQDAKQMDVEQLDVDDKTVPSNARKSVPGMKYK